MKKLFLTIAAILAPVVAVAQEAATAVAAAVTPVTTVDISPVIIALVPFVVLLGGAGLLWVVRKAGVEKLVGQQKVQEMLDKVMDQAAAYAVSNLKDAKWTKIETKHEALGYAMNYAMEHGDDLVKAAGLNTDKLYQKLEAKLLKYDEAPGQWETPSTPAPSTPAA